LKHSFHTTSLSWTLEEAIDQEQAPENSSKIKQQQIHLTTGALTHRDEAARLGVRKQTGRLDSRHSALTKKSGGVTCSYSRQGDQQW
jgi:hypothetical protein